MSVESGIIGDEELLQKMVAAREGLLREIRKAIIGQDEVVEQVLISLFVGGHSIITGVPGLAKTLLVKTISSVLDLSFKRIQFTPDLMPADITGTEVIEEDRTTGKRVLQFIKGPIFANIILADEINRTPPKTQSALLEAMQEGNVTVQGVTYPLPRPFFVLATQNPIEMEGTYPLPEAQLDRFMFNIVIDYLSEDDEVAVVTRTTSGKGEPVQRLFTGEQLLAFQQVVRKVPIAEDVARYAVRISAASRPGRDGVPDFVNQWISWGAGTRASQNLVLGAKTRALLHNRTHVTADDIRAMALPVLRHRILVNYKAEAEGVTVEKVIAKLLETVKQ
jgi:MoxR-like ATPase